jgi:hypothetical protein
MRSQIVRHKLVVMSAVQRPPDRCCVGLSRRRSQRCAVGWGRNGKQGCDRDVPRGGGVQQTVEGYRKLPYTAGVLEKALYKNAARLLELSV